MSIRQRLTHATARARFRSAPLAEVLITVNELSGEGWRVTEQHAFEAGYEGSDTRAARRAFAARLITVRRKFEQRGAERWVWAQIIPLVSGDDAMEVFDVIDEDWLTNLRNKSVAVRTEDVPGPDIERAKFVRAIEHVALYRGDEMTTRTLVCLSGPFVAIVAASSAKRSWPWDDLAAIATTQVARLPH